MTRLIQLYASTALVTFLGASTAMADVTAQQVWNDWRGLMSATGAQIGFEQADSDGILTINNLSFTTTEHAGDAATVFNLGSLVFQEQGDGTVLVLLPTDAPIVVTNDTTRITLNQSHKDLSLVVSGAPKDLSYNYKADALVLSLVEMIIEGETLTDATAELTIGDFNGTTHARNASLLEVEHDARIGALSYQIDLNHVSEDIQISTQGSMTDLRNSFEVAIPEDTDNVTMREALDAGFKAIGHASYGAIDTQFKLTQQGDVTTGSTSSKTGAMDIKFARAKAKLVEMSANFSFGPIMHHTDIDIFGKEKGGFLDLTLDHLGFGFTANLPDDIDRKDGVQTPFKEAMEAGAFLSANVEYDGLVADFSVAHDAKTYTGNAISATAGFDLFIDRNQLRYSSGSGNTNVSLTVPELPIGPLKFSASEMRSSVKAPMNVSNIPAPFSYSDRFTDLTISDNLWAMFDPDKLLPRGAVTYILDIEGMGNWLIDPFSEAFQNDNLPAPKGELHSLTLNALQLSGAGVALTGAGAFTFNNGDLETFDGMPAPTGALDLKMVGLNALLDTLIDLGLFTVAGDDQDTLISHIETTDDGHVLANGKRLK